MAFDWFTAEHLAGEWRLITGAPVLSLASLATFTGAAYGVARWRFAAELDNLKSRIQLRDDEIANYKRKVDGASPDEAEARVEAFESRLLEIEPEQLTAEQIVMVTAVARSSPGYVSIPTIVEHPAGAGVVRSLRKAFADAGWRIDAQTLLRAPKGAAGVLVFVSNISEEATARGRVVANALAAAQIPSNMNSSASFSFDAQIVVNRPWASS